MKSTHSFPRRTYSFIIISLAYFVFAAYLFNKFGVKIMNDSPRYLAYASDLNEGFHFDPLNFWYFTYVFFIFLHQLFSDHLLPIIMSQYLLGYLAVLSLYATTRIITENEVISTLSSMLFILFPDNIFWHSYILTESLYSSLLCFAFLFAIRYMKAKSHKNLVLLIFSVVLCFFCRPTSPALVFALIMPFCIKFLSYPSYRIAKITALFIILVGVLALANEMISMHRVMLIYEKGDIIFAMHQVPNSPFHDLLRVAPPADLYLPENEKELILAMLEFVVNNPLYWLKLFVSKLILYVTHIRPYWSWGHIIAVILIIWPSVFFGFSAVKKRLVHKPLLIPFLTYFLVHLLIVCNTWVDWDARFFTPLFPVLALLAAIGLHHEYEKFIKPWFIKTHI